MLVLFSGVFNGAEAWRQCHTGHNAQGKTAVKMFHCDITRDYIHLINRYHYHPERTPNELLIYSVTFFGSLLTLLSPFRPSFLLMHLWHSALQLHKQADMQEEKNRIERVLGAISAPDLIQKVLNFALSVHMTTFTPRYCLMLVCCVLKENQTHFLLFLFIFLDVIFHCCCS